jgi:hypothetical protein
MPPTVICLPAPTERRSSWPVGRNCPTMAMRPVTPLPSALRLPSARARTRRGRSGALAQQWRSYPSGAKRRHDQRRRHRAGARPPVAQIRAQVRHLAARGQTLPPLPTTGGRPPVARPFPLADDRRPGAGGGANTGLSPAAAGCRRRRKYGRKSCQITLKNHPRESTPDQSLPRAAAARRQQSAFSVLVNEINGGAPIVDDDPPRYAGQSLRVHMDEPTPTIERRTDMPKPTKQHQFSFGRERKVCTIRRTWFKRLKCELSFTTTKVNILLKRELF